MINIVKPFSVRMVLESQTCPPAGEAILELRVYNISVVYGCLLHVGVHCRALGFIGESSRALRFWGLLLLQVCLSRD